MVTSSRLSSKLSTYKMLLGFYGRWQTSSAGQRVDGRGSVLEEAGVQVEQAVEAPAVDGGGLRAEARVQLGVHQREQLLHVAVVRARREHLAQRLDVPRARLRVAPGHEP